MQSPCLATPVLPDEWRAAVNVLLEALRHKANDTATEADNELLRLVEHAVVRQSGQPHENGVVTGSLAG